MRNHAADPNYAYMRVSHNTILDRLRSDADLRVALEDSIQLIRRRKWLHNSSSQEALRKLARMLERSKPSVSLSL